MSKIKNSISEDEWDRIDEEQEMQFQRPNKTVHLGIRADEHLNDDLKRIAKEQNVTVSSAIRSLLLVGLAEYDRVHNRKESK